MRQALLVSVMSRCYAIAELPHWGYRVYFIFILWTKSRYFNLIKSTSRVAVKQRLAATYVALFSDHHCSPSRRLYWYLWPWMCCYMLTTALRPHAVLVSPGCRCCALSADHSSPFVAQAVRVLRTVCRRGYRRHCARCGRPASWSGCSPGTNRRRPSTSPTRAVSSARTWRSSKSTPGTKHMAGALFGC